MADASEEFRRVFTGALEEESGLELAAETGDGQETVRLAKELSPDIVVMDFVLARMDGLEVLSELAALPGPGCWCSPALRGAIWRSWPRPMARTTI